MRHSPTSSAAKPRQPDVAEKQVSGSRVIAADAADIFAVLANAARHADFDGSGTVKSASSGGDEPLKMGSKFGMNMRIVVPYKIGNTVVEFEQDRLIAWEHFGKHRWRYELEPVEGGTQVTETFDYSTSLFPKGIELMGYPDKHRVNIAKTLERLEALF